ncbi:MAG: hypothetical protein QF436_01045 [Candidatus Woesearchaeota archaeon]|jgi:hypothetical protein|nr:hypothetical protein [Candidatus Woesearchaeota archaeon]MDP7622679.1 hypothetical protein [Candidatus Woesearchaeota archaeon]HJN57230.1 hypothetical protein [Candidatus Woesearchaeota archaeon]|tara:strand:+ start:994 stop:1602 length:609 start_codon:yes stop_codon:yes gene_type:complete
MSYRSDISSINWLPILTVIIAVIALGLSIYNYHTINKTAQPQVTLDQFLQTLTAHEEMTAYIGITPVNIVQITQDNLANFQNQMTGLSADFIGNFIVQYQDRIVLYDYDNDQITGNVQVQQSQEMPQDFFQKLYTHPEVSDLNGQTPIGGGVLDAESLNSLKQQLPTVYADAKVGDFLLRYDTKLVIYDYQSDNLVNVVALQ